MTHDVRTMTRFAWERVERGEPMPGVIEVLARAPIGQVVDDLLLVLQCSEAEDFRDRVFYLPLR